jgi:hypothetical protein
VSKTCSRKEVIPCRKKIHLSRTGILKLSVAWDHVPPFLLTRGCQGYKWLNFIETLQHFIKLSLTKPVPVKLLDAVFARLIRPCQLEFLYNITYIKLYFILLQSRLHVSVPEEPLQATIHLKLWSCYNSTKRSFLSLLLGDPKRVYSHRFPCTYIKTTFQDILLKVKKGIKNKTDQDNVYAYFVKDAFGICPSSVKN